MKDFKRKGHSSLLENLKTHCKFPLIDTFLETLIENSKEVSCWFDSQTVLIVSASIDNIHVLQYMYVMGWRAARKNILLEVLAP